MSRGDGFPIADLDVGFLDDAKVRRLIRSTRDEGVTARAIVAYLAIVTASWAAGDRLALEDSVPLWITAPDDLAERLAGVGLLDDAGKIPERAWESWYGPARDRREERRQSGRMGGLAKAAHLSASRATAQLEHSHSEALPVRTVPSVTDPNTPSDIARETARRPRTNGDPVRVGAVLANLTTCPVCGDALEMGDPGVAVEPGTGQLWHKAPCRPVTVEP